MRKGKGIIIVFCLIYVFCTPSVASDVRVTVDASRVIETLPPILSTSIWVKNLDLKGEFYTLSKFFKDHRPAVVQLTLPFLRHTKSFEDFKESMERYLNLTPSILLIDKAKKYDVLLIIGYDPCPIPYWLSSDPGNMKPVTGGDAANINFQSCSPPNNYKQWGEIVKYTLQYFRALGLNKLGFYVGHEPDWDWLGSEDELFKYYKFAAEAAKSVSSDIVVGGIGTSNSASHKQECEKYGVSATRKLCLKNGWTKTNKTPIIENFINKSKINGTPLDFINWHSFGIHPASFLSSAETIKKWLENAGFDEQNVKLYPSDWTYWIRQYPADYLDTNETAAYISNAVFYMWKAGIQWHGHDFDVGSYIGLGNLKRRRTNSTFVGDWSLFTGGGMIGGGIIKPAYNAFKALSLLTRQDKNESLELIQTNFSGKETITAFSVLSDTKRKISLLVSNFTPDIQGRTIRFNYRAIFNRIETETDILKDEKDLIRECVKENKTKRKKSEENAFMQCKNKLVSKMNDPQKLETLNFVEKIFLCMRTKNARNCLLNKYGEIKYQETRKIANAFNNYLDARENSKKVQIHFTEIPFNGKANILTYTIDSTHSNACGFNKRTEPQKTKVPCGIGGAVDKGVWEAVVKGREEGIKKAIAYLRTVGYTDNEMKYLKDGIKRCNNIKSKKRCLNIFVNGMSTKLSYPPEKIQMDLKAALVTYRKALGTFYYMAIDKINNWKEVSLEGSEKNEVINIENSQYILNLNMEPNSISLVVLTNESPKNNFAF